MFTIWSLIRSSSFVEHSKAVYSRITGTYESCKRMYCLNARLRLQAKRRRVGVSFYARERVSECRVSAAFIYQIFSHLPLSLFSSLMNSSCFYRENDEGCCAVCLDDFEEGASVRELPCKVRTSWEDPLPPNIPQTPLSFFLSFIFTHFVAVALFSCWLHWPLAGREADLPALQV